MALQAGLFNMPCGVNRGVPGETRGLFEMAAFKGVVAGSSGCKDVSGVGDDMIAREKKESNPEVGLSSVEKIGRSACENLACVQKSDRRNGYLTVATW